MLITFVRLTSIQTCLIGLIILHDDLAIYKMTLYLEHILCQCGTSVTFALKIVSMKENGYHK